MKIIMSDNSVFLEKLPERILLFSVYSQLTRVSIGSCTTFWTLPGSVSERRLVFFFS